MSMAPITFSSRHQPAPPLFNLSFGSDLNDELLDKMDVHHTCSTPMGQHPVNHYRGASIAVSNTSASPLFSFSCSQAKDNSKTQASNTSIPSFMTTPAKDCKGYLKLSKWGIPELVLEQYSRRGISSMYEWQAECLMKPGVLQGGNLVFSAPTSAGKTFIAELLALKCVLETRKKVVIILPFVSIAHEKSNYLRSIFEPNGVKVGGFMGRQSPQGGFAAVDIAICTIEKANSLLNQLLKEDGINSLGTVVVDELHMIGDSHRGYLLELLLTKLLYFCRKNEKCLTFSKQGNSSQEVNCCSSTIQIVGMSATLPNLDVLAGWLGSQLYCTEERPVPLQEMIKIGPTLYNTQMKRIRDLGDPNLPANDEDDILKLCEKTIINGHSVLIFCPTKQWCENLAASIASAPFIHTATPLPTRRYILDGVALNGVVEQLRRTQVGLDNVLKKTIPCGVAFHHAGLTFDEREIVEGAFRQGLVKVLVATSTLSSGVNLPARMVIVRTPFFQRSLLDVLVYKQMVGRAGRKGVDERGESVLICKASEKSKVASLFQSSPKPIQSCLGQKSVRKAQIHDVSSLRRALLEVIVIGTATSHYELETYIKCTLLFAEMSRKQQKSPKPTSSKATPSKDSSAIVNKLIQSTVDYLIANEFIATRTSTQMRASSDGIAVEYYATQLGAACVASCLSPEEALVVFAELRNARRNFVLENELHIIYLVSFKNFSCK